ncbi:Fur family transcriptional regulator [Microvirga sp. 2YAF29]|uniref:Fur family transcriptional regulator n=1 Tax=Microvirga sp. 2YAF29 TaxID=3233031 RepID=UPI003F9CB1B0
MTQPVVDRSSNLREPAKSIRIPENVAKSLSQAEEACKAQRARLTPIRRRVLEALHMASKPLGAYNLAALVAPQGRKIAPITVYRALDFLIEQGLAHRIASLNAYVAQDGEPGSATHAFLICEGCGEVTDIPSPEIAHTLSSLLKQHSFSSHAKALEITGRCSHC